MAGQSKITGGIATRYATALFELADESGALDAVHADLKSIKAMLDGSEDLARFLASPLYSRDDHNKALGVILDKAGMSSLTKQFIGTVANKRRLFTLGDMITSFAQQLAEKRGEVTADVTSAHPLSDAQLAQIKESLKAQLEKDVTLETSVDANLLGGLVVRVGSRMIDSSIRTKLNRLQLNLKEAS